MANIKLNHRIVWELMTRDLLRPADLAKKLGINRQSANYVLYHGGVKYADKLAKIFGCRKNDLLVMNTSRD